MLSMGLLASPLSSKFPRSKRRVWAELPSFGSVACFGLAPAGKGYNPSAKQVWETRVLLLSKALQRSPWAGKASFPNPVSQIFQTLNLKGCGQGAKEEMGEQLSDDSPEGPEVFDQQSGPTFSYSQHSPMMIIIICIGLAISWSASHIISTALGIDAVLILILYTRKLSL